MKRNLLLGSRIGTALLFLTDFARSSFSRESAGQRRKWGTLAGIALLVLPAIGLHVLSRELIAGLPSAPGIAYVVDSTGDGGNVGNNTTCDDGTGHCTLRAAIEAANSHVGNDGIFFNIPITGNTLRCLRQLHHQPA